MTHQPRLWSEPQSPTEVLPHDGSAVLWPNFLIESDEIYRQLVADIPWEEHYITMFGKRTKEPRLSAWFHTDGVAYEYSRSVRQANTFTPLLSQIMEHCEQAAGARFNSVLANLYRDGSDAMGWHADDEPELGREPVIASISLGAERRFDFRHRESGDTVRVVLPHGSLLVMSGQTQHCWVHQIARTTRVSEPRINLTFRFTHSQ